MRTLLAAATLILLSLGISLAQDMKPYKEVGKTYMADTSTHAQGVDSATAMRLLQRPLLSRDSAGVMHTVSTYTFTYACRSVFSDADGRPFVGTDYFSTESNHGILPAIWVQLLPTKLKTGDTIIVEQPKTYTTNKKNPEFNSPGFKIFIK